MDVPATYSNVLATAVVTLSDDTWILATKIQHQTSFTMYEHVNVGETRSGKKQKELQMRMIHGRISQNQFE